MKNLPECHHLLGYSGCWRLLLKVLDTVLAQKDFIIFIPSRVLSGIRADSSWWFETLGPLTHLFYIKSLMVPHSHFYKAVRGTNKVSIQHNVHSKSMAYLYPSRSSLSTTFFWNFYCFWRRKVGELWWNCWMVECKETMSQRAWGAHPSPGCSWWLSVEGPGCPAHLAYLLRLPV